MKNINPKISLKIDIDEDVRNAIIQLKHASDWAKTGSSLKWFLPEEVQFILDSTFSQKEQNKILAAYTKNIYKIRKEEINKYFKLVKEDWKRVESDYFGLVDKIFEKHPWPKGNYIGYATIFNVYTRNISEKTFIFPYVHNLPHYANSVIAHEMLHILFFDFIKENYKLSEDDVITGKSEQYIWEVSEVFNNVIEDWQPYKEIFKNEPILYHGKVKMFEKMKRQWQEKQDVKWLLDKWLA